MDGLDGRMNKLEGRFDSLEARIEARERRCSTGAFPGIEAALERIKNASLALGMRPSRWPSASSG